MSQLNAILVELFRAHGVDTVLQREWVAFPPSRCRANASIGQEIPNQGALTVQLDVRFEVALGRVVLESFAGMGATKEEAIRDGFRNFTANSFHVLLAAFLRPDDENIHREEWTIGGRPRRVVVGNVGIRGNPPVDGEKLLGWFASARRMVEAQDLGPESHWLRLYYGQARGKSLACEARLDNDVWEEMQAELAAFAWPPNEVFYGVRLFLVVEGEERDEITPEGVVGHLAETLAANPDLTEDGAYAALADAGVPEALADRAYKFTQLAWGRLLLRTANIAFSPDYFGFDADGNLRETGKLTDEPSFVTASRIGPRYIALPACQRLGLGSADVDAVNNALKAGAKLENLVMAPACFFENPTPAGMQNAQQFIAQHIAALRAQHPPKPTAPEQPPTQPTKAPKWQFWKR